jgi:hypothetical protein
MPYNVANEEEGTLLPGSVQFEEKAPERKSRSFLLTALLLVSCSVVGYAAGSSQVLHSSTFTNLHATGSMYDTTSGGMTGSMMTGGSHWGTGGTAAAPATYPAYNGAHTAAAPATYPAYNGAHTAAAPATYPAYNGANTDAADLATAKSRVVSLEDEVGALKAQVHAREQADEARSKAMAENEARRAEEEAKERAAHEEAEAKERAAREEAEAKEEAARKARDEAIRAGHEAMMKAHEEDMAGHNKFREEVHQGAHVVANQVDNAMNGLEQAEENLKSAKEITDKITKNNE